ncbi:MAG TPA: hypothetical protein VGI55_17490 [Solirubrobacteraceae bacterium]|jgi:hypothetical protein
MSPVAFDLASADSAAGALAAALVVVEGAAGAVAGAVAPEELPAPVVEEDEEPHPAATAEQARSTLKPVSRRIEFMAG